MKQIFTV